MKITGKTVFNLQSLFIIFAVFIALTSCENPMMLQVLDPRTITFDTNGGSAVSPQNLYRGEKIAEPQEPVKEDNAFEGWYTDNAEYITKWDFNDIPKEGMTLYAKWKSTIPTFDDKAKFMAYLSSLKENSTDNPVKVKLVNFQDKFSDIVVALDQCQRYVNLDLSDSGISINTASEAGYVYLTGIILPKGITKIEGDAFFSCVNLKSVTIPNSVTSIESGAFSACESLKRVTIPNNVTSIGPGVFRGCTSLTGVTIGSSVTEIGASAFQNCTSLTSITIGSGVTSIGMYTFQNCTSLTSVTIPNSVITIRDTAFFQCTSLTSVTIGDSVTSIGNSAFASCTSLKSITIPNRVISIGTAAFTSCSSLTSVTIPDSVISIGFSAFSKCTNLIQVTFDAAEITFGSGGEPFDGELRNVYLTDGIGTYTRSGTEPNYLWTKQ
jgi:uncharacterized repeat protein (TIGR02543 family)